MLLIPTRLAASSIHGLGVVTTMPIRSGSAIWRFQPGFDASFSQDQVDRLPAAAREFVHHFAYLDRPTGCWILNADHGRFMNHSETPNTGVGNDPIPGDLGIITVALVDLPAGAELTCDYREFDADAKRKLSGPAASPEEF